MRLYVDLPSFPSPSLITGDSLRPDFALISPDNTLYILELTVGFETNIVINGKHKAMTNQPILQQLSSQYRKIYFTNLSLSALDISKALTTMKDFGKQGWTQTFSPFSR